MGDIQETFLNADSLVPGAMITQVAGRRAVSEEGGELGVSAEAMFDDDLDVGGAAPAPGRSAGSASHGASSSAGLVMACKARCADVLAIVGPLQPDQCRQAALHWLDQRPGGLPHPETLRLALVDAMCRCAAVAVRTKDREATQMVSSAAEQLKEVMDSTKFHNGLLEFVMLRTRRLAEALQGAACSVPSWKDRKTDYSSLMLCVALLQAGQGAKQLWPSTTSSTSQTTASPSVRK